jgi:hypothetical protein
VIPMGRSYWFECSKCGYRAQVSGGPDRGHNFYLQTVACGNCKRLFDAVTKVRVPDTRALEARQAGSSWRQRLKFSQDPVNPPSFQSVLNRLPLKGVKHFKWLHYRLQCPVSALHKVEAWNAPNKCPCCGTYLERTVLPYRIWD